MIDELRGLVLVYTVWSLPFALWMLRATSPRSPRPRGGRAIDGASRCAVLVSIVLPLLAPGLVATALFTFIGSWNEFFFALVLIQIPELRDAAAHAARFVGSEGQVQLGQLAAGVAARHDPEPDLLRLIQRRLTSGPAQRSGQG